MSALAALAVLSPAPAALANSSSSANWAGYAAHRGHARFRQVFASWTQPSLTCTPGQISYSAFWVGLGGYSKSARALEQVGTEADCTASGAARMSAWYELVPSPSRRLQLAVHAGDRLAASVSVSGHEVEIKLWDTTTTRWATKRVHASRLDLTSAEWITEAPSACDSGSCVTLPLANFGSTSFEFAGAELSRGRIAAISSRRWSLTKITLHATGRRFSDFHPAAGAEATPTALSNRGTAFSVRYSPFSVPGVSAVARDVAVFHLGR